LPTTPIITTTTTTTFLPSTPRQRYHGHDHDDI